MGSQTITWNPDEYLKFGDHRLRPALDLLARIDLKSSRAMYNLGCGTGNTTELLSRRWPDTNVTGIDSSPEMLEKTSGSCPELNLTKADLASWRPESKADLVFSNAALHWLGRHETLFPRLMEILSKDGRLAVQIPSVPVQKPAVIQTLGKGSPKRLSFRTTLFLSRSVDQFFIKRYAEYFRHERIHDQLILFSRP